MRSYLTILLTTMRRNSRDKKSMISMMLQPLLMILILGTALSGLFSIKDMDPIRVAVVNLDQGAAGKSFDQFLNAEGVSKLLDAQQISDEATAMEKLKNKDVRGVVIVPDTLSASMMNGKTSSIRVLTRPDDAIWRKIISGVVDQYTLGANTYGVLSANGSKAGFLQDRMLREEPLHATGHIPKAMDYYAVTMLVMIMLYGAQYGLYGISEDYFEGMRGRLMSAPVPLGLQLAATVGGTILTVFLQGLFVIVVSARMFQVNWGHAYWEMALVLLMASAMSVSLGVLAACAFRRKEIASAVVTVFIPVSTFISGGYMKIVSDNPNYLTVRSLMPSNMGQSALFSLIYSDTPHQDIVRPLVSMLVVILVAGTAAILLGRRKLA